jgi:hypothetical protein
MGTSLALGGTPSRSWVRGFLPGPSECGTPRRAHSGRAKLVDLSVSSVIAVTIHLGPRGARALGVCQKLGPRERGGDPFGADPGSGTPLLNPNKAANRLLSVWPTCHAGESCVSWHVLRNHLRAQKTLSWVKGAIDESPRIAFPAAMSTLKLRICGCEDSRCRKPLPGNRKRQQRFS